MTDQQTYTKDDGTVLLEVRPDWRSAKNGKLLIKLPIVSDHDSIVIPAAELLAMIDAADPDAMRAYLRETAPEVIADLYRPEIPEADSPEDVDEQPDPVTFEWEDPPALNSPGSRPAQYWIGITIMLRSRRGAWAKVGENVNPDSYRRQLRARGCEVTTRNRRNGNRCDVYARFPRSGGAR